MNQPELKELSLSDLRTLLAAAERAKAIAVADIAAINAEITSRLSDTAAKLFEKSEKTAGDVTFETPDGGKFKASISKTVSWDSGQLQSIARQLPYEQVELLFDIKFAVPEAKYKALTDPALKAKLDEARTVKYGELSIKPVEK